MLTLKDGGEDQEIPSIIYELQEIQFYNWFALFFPSSLNQGVHSTIYTHQVG